MLKNIIQCLAIATGFITLSSQTALADWQACGGGQDTGVCLAVLCKPDGRLGFYGAGIDTTDIVDVILHLGNGDFSFSPISGLTVEPYPIGFFTAFPERVLDGLKTDYAAAISFAGHRVDISLQGSFAAISAIERNCMAPEQPDHTGRPICGHVSTCGRNE